jgi:hypothetical protein
MRKLLLKKNRATTAVAIFNDYYRQVLKVESEEPHIVSGNLWKDWATAARRSRLQSAVPEHRGGPCLRSTRVHCAPRGRPFATTR